MRPKLQYIQIRTGDIENGKRHDCWECPVALALQRKYPHLAQYVTVNLDYIDIGAWKTPTHPVAQQWMEEFDKGKRVRAGILQIADRRGWTRKTLAREGASR